MDVSTHPIPERLVEAAEAALPSTSGQSIFPVTAAELGATQSGPAQLNGSPTALILLSMAAVFLLSCLAAYLTFLRLMNLEQKRRERVTAGRVYSLPAVVTNKKPVMSKVSPMPDAHAANEGSKSAPETPEQLYTPKQVRSSNRDLSEEADDEPGPGATASSRRGSLSKAALARVPAGRGPIAVEGAEGEQHREFPDGGEYFGEWQGGLAKGRGIYVWPSGVRYEGEWKDGMEHGVGTLIEADGSTFYGFWAEGKMHGEGVYKPASGADVITMRDYAEGVLRKENVLRIGQVDHHKNEVKADRALRSEEKRANAKELNKQARPGETIYKGHRSYDLMRNLQLGIIFSIARSTKEASDGVFDGPAKEEEFAQQVTQYFPRGEQSVSFKWKDYCPSIFSRLRDTFGIDNKDYLLSLTGDQALRELPSPGKSGSVFFLSGDDRFMIKTVSHEEMLLLLKMIPAYYRHCVEHPATLLTRFYGVHRIKSITKGGSKVRFVVMGSVFPTEVRLHRKYDLKGSTHGRTVGSKKLTHPSTCLKDLDLDMRLALAKGAHAALMRQIEADAALLARMHVMDYSLLLGVHYPKWGPNTWYPPHTSHRENKEGTDERKEGERLQEQQRKQLRHVDTTLLERNQKEHFARAAPASNGDGGDASAANHVPSAGIASVVRESSQQNGGPAAMPAPGGGHIPANGPVSTQQLPEQERVQQQEPGSRGGQASVGPTAAQLAMQSGTPGASGFMPSPFLEASDLGFDDPKAVAKAVSFRRREGDTLDLSDQEQRRRVSVELGMGGASRSSLFATGSSGLRGQGRMMSLHSELRAQLGVAVPAMALPEDTSEDPEPVLLFFGIVDFLQHYNLRKRSEHAFKSILMDRRQISCADPKSYADRFCKFMGELFVARGNR
ncbi:probable phosphatidylinositol 4-phosphate 5-kinase 1 [Coccomyxa sp. Obi]|nr:probable phosphatidylinositol 4-phosphate 5-kinase 1 [Coccomyxa sp. Obi]